MAQNAMQRFVSGVRQVFNRGEDPRRTIRHYYPLPVQAAGLTLTYDSATQLSVVWACMDAITKAIAPSSWNVFERRGRQRVMLPDDPLHWLLNVRPNPEMTAIAFRECIMFQALSWGNSYAEIVRDGSGKVIQLWPMLSDRVALRRAFKDDGSPGDLYYQYYQYDQSTIILRPDQVFHLRGPSPTGWMGDNVVARAAKAIALGVASERFSSAFFANGATAGLVLKNERPHNDKDYERVKARWNDEHAGPDKASRVAVLDGGWQIDSLSTKPVDMELIQSRKFQLEEICRFFGVPPHRVQELSRATLNNIEHLGLEFVRDALTPWAERLEQEADFKLLPQRVPWRNTDIDLAWLSHGDAVSRATYYEKMRNIGAFSANDILERENMNTIGPEGDLRVVMSNYTSYEGIQAMVDQTNAENESLRAGKPDPTPKLVDPAAPSDEESDVQNAAVSRVFAAAPELPAGLPDVVGGSAVVALRGAVRTMVAGSLERYAKRLQNRRADLERPGRKGPASIEGSMVEERANQRPKLLIEIEEAMSYLRQQCAVRIPVRDFLTAADAVDNGIDPLSAALLLVPKDDEPISGSSQDIPSSQS